MTQWIDWASIGSFLSHVAVGLGLLFIGVMVFELTTKFNDRELIKKGNVAVALKLWGKGIGLAIVIFTVWSNSLNLVDATLWGVVGIITQVVAYWVIEVMGKRNWACYCHFYCMEQQLKFGRCNSLGSSRYHYSSSGILGY